MVRSAAIAFVLLLLSAPRASAQTYDHGLRLEVGGGFPLGDPAAARFDAGGGFGAGYELRFLPVLGVEAHYDSYFFLTKAETSSGFGGYHAPGLGLRLHPLPDLEIGDVYAAPRGAAVITGRVVRPGLEVEVGFEIAVSDAFHFGPFVRYAHVFQTDEAELSLGQGDGRFLMIGISGAVVIGGGGPAVDTDGDGLSDGEDRCPREPEDRDGFEDEDGCPDADNDQDGVPDGDDRCPMEAEDRDGFEDEDGCPDADNDQDGLLDGDDRCPDEAEDRNGQDDEDGCPDGDRDDDEDGVPNVSDRCPDVPEDRDGFEDEDGCPDTDNDQDGVPDGDDRCPLAPGPAEAHGCPVSVRVETREIRILQRIEFDRNRAEIRRRSYPILEEVAQVLAANPQIRRVRVEGHTDAHGTDEYNQELSQRRAEAVVAWLTAHGVEASRLRPVGRGRSQPLQDNRTEAGRQANRRVEFHIEDDE